MSHLLDNRSTASGDRFAALSELFDAGIGCSRRGRRQPILP
jgi:hypothetical protein